MKKRTISVLLMICMIILSANGLSALAFNEIDSEEVILEPIQTEANDNIYNKIHFYFGEDAYQTIDTFDELTKAVNNTAKKVNETAAAMSRSGNVSEESLTNEICVTVEFASDYMQTKEFLAFSEERNHLDSIDEVHEFRSRLNAFSKSYHEKIAKENIKDLSAISYTKVRPIAYSPFVTMTMPVDNVNVSSLKSVAENTNVLEISLSYQSASYEPEFELQEEVESRSQSVVGPGDHLRAVNAYDKINADGLTGEGIRIGVYEADGVCDVNRSNLADIDITVGTHINGTTFPVDLHATKVTSVLVEIAKDASYYVYSGYDTFGIEWFIDQECDIVNISAGDRGELIVYDFYDAILDYHIKTSYVTVVVASGNYIATIDTENKISSPGYAYNAITVGGVQYDDETGWIHDPRASYGCPTNIMKPNIAAPYTVYIDAYNESPYGTSYSAPVVTGCLALFMESHPYSMIFPEDMLSMVTSTAQKTADYSISVGANRHNDLKVGAGILNFEGMYNIAGYERKTITNSPRYTTHIDENIYLEAGQEIQIGVAWLVTAYSSTGGSYQNAAYVTDYNLYLYDPSYTPGGMNMAVATSQLSASNVEMLRYTATTTGWYKLTVSQWSDMAAGNTGDRMMMTYTIKSPTS